MRPQVSRKMRVGAWVVLASLAMGNMAEASAQSNLEQVQEKVNTSSIVHYTTGINPDDYPCAKAGISKLYEQRKHLSDLSAFNPKRIFVWVMDTSIYYTMRFVDFLKGLMNPNAVANGIRNIESMARGGNPLAGMDSRVSAWARDLSPSSQYALQRKVKGIIEDTTNSDGTCKG